MRLTNIRILNHARLADVDIEVRDHLVLVGPNDVGKSSLLRCLDLILGASTAQLYSRISADDFRDPNQPFVIEAQLEEFTDEDRALFPDEINIDPITGRASLIVQLSASIDTSETVDIHRRALGAGHARQLSRDQVLGLEWKFLGATHQTRDLREDRRSPLDEILQAVELGSEEEDFESIAEALAKKLDDSVVLGTLREDLAAQLSRALPEPINSNELVFVPGASADDDVLSGVRLRVSKAGTSRDLSAQSDGTRALFAMAFYDLVSIGANMIGIDEPEIHLHPTSQRSLARLLKSNPNQKIIATHSSDIVSAFEADSIAVVRPGGEIVQPELGFLSENEKLIVRWWVRDRLEPLTSRRVIVVEGPSDRIILEGVAEATDRNLDRLGISIVEAGSKNSIPSIEKLFGEAGFGIPLSQLIDEDAEAKTAKRLGVEVESLDTKSVWVSRVDLEDEYVAALGAQNVWRALKKSSLFTANKLKTCTPSGHGDSFTEDDVATFCRSSKVEAAVVVADMLEKDTAQKITSVESLLSKIAQA